MASHVILSGFLNKAHQVMAGEEASRKNLDPTAGRASESGSGAIPLLEMRMRVPLQCESPSRCYQEDGTDQD